MTPMAPTLAAAETRFAKQTDTAINKTPQPQTGRALTPRLVLAAIRAPVTKVAILPPRTLSAAQAQEPALLLLPPSMARAAEVQTASRAAQTRYVLAEAV